MTKFKIIIFFLPMLQINSPIFKRNNDLFVVIKISYLNSLLYSSI